MSKKEILEELYISQNNINDLVNNNYIKIDNKNDIYHIILLVDVKNVYIDNLNEYEIEYDDYAFFGNYKIHNMLYVYDQKIEICECGSNNKILQCKFKYGQKYDNNDNKIKNILNNIFQMKRENIKLKEENNKLKENNINSNLNNIINNNLLDLDKQIKNLQNKYDKIKQIQLLLNEDN